MNRFAVIFDNAPAEGAPWIERACALAKIKFVSNDPITTAIGEDAEARKVMEKRPLDYVTPFPQIGPYFQKALDKVAPKDTRVGLHGVNWLTYGTKAAAAIIDLDPLEAEMEKGRKGGMKEEDVKKYGEMFGTRMQEMAKKALGSDRVLVLPKGTPDAKKAELAAAHIKKFDK